MTAPPTLVPPPAPTRFSALLELLPTVLQPGDIVGGHLLVERLLGRGGMAEVYDALDTALQRRVAIKVPGSAATARGEAGLLRAEGRALAALRHPGLPAVHGFG